MLVLARDTGKDHKSVHTLWWVDSNKPGIKINPLHKIIGWHVEYMQFISIMSRWTKATEVGEEGIGFLNVLMACESKWSAFD
ncbi:hypothetical protein KCP71_20430 [Salmonella enterica subsp. enterica]|nr:hypothetical protein KCP71_20430 [Salmonella enterica subsp. enterica]